MLNINKSYALPSYISLVRPILEYASSVWDPYQYNKIYIVLMEYSIEQLTGHCVIMRDIAIVV